MPAMRTTGLVILASALVVVSACRCNKAPGPQTTPSVQPSASTATVSSQGVPGGAGPMANTGDVGAAGATGVAEAEPVVVIRPLDFAPAKGSKFKAMKLKEDGTIA